MSLRVAHTVRHPRRTRSAFDRTLAAASRARERGDLAMARVLYEQVVSSSPNNGAAWNNLGLVYQQSENIEEALRCYLKAGSLLPEVAGIHANAGNMFRECKRFREAVEAYERAVALAPGNAEIHCSLAVALLADGQYERGWAEYEWRRHSTEIGIGVRTYPRPLWDGAPLSGRRLLVYAEQGLGDTVQFLRFAGMLEHLEGHVILACQPDLIPLCRSLPGVRNVVAFDSPTLPGFDVYAALMSLPHLLRCGGAVAPPVLPYVTVSADGGRRGNATRIGLVWASNTANRLGTLKSLPFGVIRSLAKVPDVEWINLQMSKAGSSVAEETAGFPLKEGISTSSSIEETAALLASLDAVVSADTFVAHLAGAMGKPVFLLLPFAADWRWGRDEHETLWYPTMRLFRQQVRGEWDEPIRCLADALRTRGFGHGSVTQGDCSR